MSKETSSSSGLGNGAAVSPSEPDNLVEHEQATSAKKTKKDPFADFDKLRAKNEAAFLGKTETSSVTVTLGSPPNDKYFKCHPNDDWYTHAMLWFDQKDRRKIYYIDPDLWDLPDLQGPIKPTILVPWMTAEGDFGLWPVKIGQGSGDWADSALEAVSEARREYRRVQSDTSAGKWRYFPPRETIADRAWPADLTREKYYRLAFGSRIVVDEDHDLIRRLRGLSKL